MAKSISITLTEDDVNSNAKQIVEDMQKIRQECTAERLVKNKAEYSALARRFASCIKARGSNLSEKAASLDKILEKEPLLWSYDPLQLKYWNNNNDAAEFIKRLSDLAITLLKPDNIKELFEKNGEYHCLQALKLIDNREANPVSELPASTIAGELAEAGNSIENLVAKYAECGLLRADLKIKNKAPNIASELKTKGYETMPTDKGVTVLFNTEKDIQSFFKIAFGYAQIKEHKGLFYAKTNDGYALLEKNGNEKTILGKKRFLSIKEEGNTLVLRTNDGFAYIENNNTFCNRWFEKPLDDAQRKAISKIKNNFKDIADWILELKMPLEDIAKLNHDNAKKLYDIGAQPSITLLTNTSKIDNLKEFITTYETVKFTAAEGGDNSTIWQILDTLQPETSTNLFNIMAEAYKQNPKLKQILETYQQNRTEHPDKASLLRSTLDLLLTIHAHQQKQDPFPETQEIKCR